MSEIVSNQSQKGARKVFSTRVDLTPMVDLGFLLITFFVFTSTMSQSKALLLVLPTDDHPMNTPQSGALTIITDAEKTWCYHGEFGEAIKKNEVMPVTYDNVRNLILGLKKSLMQKTGSSHDMMIMIKSTPDSYFRNTIDMLDEMKINDVSR